jgi:hypothetical protein
MSADAVLAYVEASAVLLELPLDEARAARVAVHLTRTAAMAKLLDNVPLAVDVEPAEIYCPAAFVFLADRAGE